MLFIRGGYLRLGLRYINELGLNVDEGKEGLYRGQCAELCGKGHLLRVL